MIYELPRKKCPLCSKQGDLLATKGMTHHIICDNCGDYIITLRAKAHVAVNSAMVEAYWLIGKRIVEEEQHGKNRAEYGKEVLIVYHIGGARH
jgi:transcription elongation factor Elf1